MAENPKIAVGFVVNSLPPYRTHVHQRVAREMPEIAMATLLTHEEDPRWKVERHDEIGLVSLADGVSCFDQGKAKNYWADWRTGGRVIQRLRAINARAVVLSGYNDPGRLRILIWCRLHGIPCLIWGDSNILDDFSGSKAKAIIKRIVVGGLLKLGSGALSFGNAGKAYFQKYGVRADRVFFFPMEPDYGLIRSPAPSAIPSAAARFGLAPGRRRFLFCGRLIPIKRPDLLLAAFSVVASQRPDWDLVILGDGPLREELQKNVPAELKSRVTWAGHVPEQDVVAAIQRLCDVLVLPSDRESWALVINEALAAGMAVVSSSVPGAAVDLVRDGVNGRIFPRGDLAALVQCLLDATEEATLAKMKVESARILDDWIRDADPIVGLRRALQAFGALPA